MYHPLKVCFFSIAIKKLKLTLYFVLLFWYRPVDRETVLSIFLLELSKFLQLDVGHKWKFHV